MAAMILHRFYILAAFCCALLTAAPAIAFEKDDTKYTPATQALDLDYDIYAGGFDVMKAHMTYNMKPGSYDLALESNTHGFIGEIFPWKGEYKTTGHPDKSGYPVPSQHIAATVWKDSKTRKQMDYDGNGNLLKLTTLQNKKTTEKTDIKKELFEGSVDLLTGLMMIIQSTQHTEKCEGSFPVFDGKRRFDITLVDGGRDTLKKSKYSSFKGEALRCTIKVVPVGGFVKRDAKRGWMAVQTHTEERKHPPTLWFGRLAENSPLVPVRLEIASAYGTVVAHLTNKP